MVAHIGLAGLASTARLHSEEPLDYYLSYTGHKGPDQASYPSYTLWPLTSAYTDNIVCNISIDIKFTKMLFYQFVT